MQCINWPAIRPPLAVALALMTAAATPAHAAAQAVVANIDDSDTATAELDKFDFVGRWRHISDKHDGRTDGTSTASTHIGDVAILSFRGTRVRLYGVMGPSGGRAGVALDGVSTGKIVEFYAPHIRPHELFYESPKLSPDVHTVTVAVWGTRDPRGHYYYVNIDSAEVVP